MPKVIHMLKCFVNSVFKDFIPKDAVETFTEVSEDEGVLMQCQQLQELYERRHVIDIKFLHTLLWKI